MNKKVKITIAVATTLTVGVGGYLVYRSLIKNNEAARNYLKNNLSKGSVDVTTIRKETKSAKSIL